MGGENSILWPWTRDPGPLFVFVVPFPRFVQGGAWGSLRAVLTRKAAREEEVSVVGGASRATRLPSSNDGDRKQPYPIASAEEVSFLIGAADALGEARVGEHRSKRLISLSGSSGTQRSVWHRPTEHSYAFGQCSLRAEGDLVQVAADMVSVCGIR